MLSDEVETKRDMLLTEKMQMDMEKGDMQKRKFFSYALVPRFDLWSYSEPETIDVNTNV